MDAFHAAYAPGHIDVVEGEDVEAELTNMLAELIPAASALAIADDRVVGAILVGDETA